MYVIGLMSGTSVDGIDAALVEISAYKENLSINLLAGETYDYPTVLREKILAVCEGFSLSMAQWAELDDEIAFEFALAANKIQINNPTGELIGSHGQTVFHRPPKGTESLGYSVQLGRGAYIANKSGLVTVSNFRAADIAAYGQGAPLVPLIDAYLLSHPSKTRCVQNLGGIGNVTYLPPTQQANWEEQIFGWDTGPGNALIDLAVEKLSQGKLTFDDQGNWASTGKPNNHLVKKWLQQDFFKLPPPKSTGRELFGRAYYDKCWQESLSFNLSEADWLATLTELTVASIVDSYQRFLPQMPEEVLLCGGGCYNDYLRGRLESELDTQKVLTTEELGLSPAFKEAIAFAVLAYWRYACQKPGNLPQVTGALRATLLGDIHFPYLSNQVKSII